MLPVKGDDLLLRCSIRLLVRPERGGLVLLLALRVTSGCLLLAIVVGLRILVEGSRLLRLQAELQLVLLLTGALSRDKALLLLLLLLRLLLLLLMMMMALHCLGRHQAHPTGARISDARFALHG